MTETRMTSGTEGLGWVRDQLPERKRVVARKMGGASFLLLERVIVRCDRYFI